MQKYINRQMEPAMIYGTALPPIKWRLINFDPPKPRPPLKREMQLGEIIGHRCWNLTEDYKLRSIHINHVIWEPGQILVGDATPADWDSRGIHCFKSKRSDRFARYIEDESEPYIIGTIYLWGDVVEHEFGYRGEFASVRSIDRITLSETDENIFGREDALLRLLQRKYGVGK